MSSQSAKMNKNGRLNRFLNGRGFYVALGICMVAIGVSAWTAMSKISSPPDTAQSSDTIQSVVSEAPSEEPANNTQSDVPDTRSEVSSQTEVSSTEQTSSKEEEAVEQTPTAKYFVYPIVGEVIKKFSNSELQYSVTYNDMRLHTGIDIKADAGTSVKAAGDGVVAAVENDPALGYTVKIDHGNGIVGIYGGLTKAIAVSEGETVKSGTNLGPLGTVTNECLDAPHLHLEFYKDNAPVDPLTLLSQ